MNAPATLDKKGNTKGTSTFAKNGQRPAHAADIVTASAADGLTSQPTTSTVNADIYCTQSEITSGERRSGWSAGGWNRLQDETLASDVATRTPAERISHSPRQLT
jgi:hypothetical protein